MRSIAVAATLLAAAAPALAAGADHGELLRRVSAANGGVLAGLRVADGALPPGFGPTDALPPLALLGSSWLAGTSPPQRVRVYYRPAPDASAQLAALGASLKQRRYVRATASGFASLFVGDDGPTQRWCPPDYGPALFVTLVRDGARRALDVDVLASSAEPCASAARRELVAPVPLPVLGNVDGLAIASPSRRVENGRIVSRAVVRSALLQSSVLARLAARFVADGWRGDPPVVEGEALSQRFTRAVSGWTVDVRLVQRAPNAFDALAVASASSS